MEGVTCASATLSSSVVLRSMMTLSALSSSPSLVRREMLSMSPGLSVSGKEPEEGASSSVDSLQRREKGGCF